MFCHPLYPSLYTRIYRYNGSIIQNSWATNCIQQKKNHNYSFITSQTVLQSTENRKISLFEQEKLVYLNNGIVIDKGMTPTISGISPVVHLYFIINSQLFCAVILFI